MLGRKFSTVAIVGALAAVAALGACRDDATGPSGSASKDFASSLRLLSGDRQVGSVGLPLTGPVRLRVVDAGGDPVQGASVTWSVIAGGGTVSPPTAVSDADGQVAASWTLGTELGENRVRAYLTTSYLLDSTTFVATAVAGAPVTIVVDTTQLPASARVTSALSGVPFTVLDQYGHPVEGAIVGFAAAGGSGAVTPATGTTDDNGKVSANWTLGTTAGVQSFNATLAGQLPVIVTTTATPDTSRRISVLSGNNQLASPGTQLGAPVQVAVADQYGNAIVGELVTFNDSVGGGDAVTPASSATDASGIASANWSLGPRVGLHRIRVRHPGSGGQLARVTSTAQLVFRDVFAGNFTTCGIATNNRAYCWGFGEDGQLGNNSAISRPAPEWPVTSTIDTIGGPFPSMRTISAGRNHVCGVAVANTIFCWGFSPDSRNFISPAPGRQLVATDISLSTPQPVNAQLASTRLVGAGEAYSCAITFGGTIYCSGNNEAGQAGRGPPIGGVVVTGAVDTTNTPPAAGGPRRFSFVAVGERHACAMPRFDPTNAVTQVTSRTPWCWGHNDNGQLGNAFPGAMVTDSAFPGIVNTTGLPAGSVFDSTSIVAGSAHTCALTPAGAAYCWGSNSFGQVGKAGVPGAGARDSAPQLVAGAIGFAKLYAGQYHTCGLTPTGQAFCWGLNSSGQLGDGTQINQNAPVAVAGGLSFHNLALGERHSCGITGPGPTPAGVTTPAGVIWCWGDNERGQSGTGTFGMPGLPALAPQRVAFQQ